MSGELAPENDSAAFVQWCTREFCGVEPPRVVHTTATGAGSCIGGAVLPHTIPMYEARHRPEDHRNKSLAAIDQVRRHLEQARPDVIVLASTHWMPRDGFFIDDGAQHVMAVDTCFGLHGSGDPYYRHVVRFHESKPHERTKR